MVEVIRHPAPPLPATTDDMLRMRRHPPTSNLNDMIEELHKTLWNNADYKRLINAVWDSEAVEGSLAADNYACAELIRQTAKSKDPDHPIAAKNWATISKAHGVVLRRYRLDRKTRRQEVDGEIVPSGDNGEA